MRACGTRSCSMARRSPLIFATHSCWRLITGPAGMSPKYFSTFCLRVGGGDVAGEHEHRVGGAVVGAEPVLHVLERGRVEVFHRADGLPRIRMAGRIGVCGDDLGDLAVGLVLALALLVLHHAALLVEHLLVDGAEQVAHAVGFHPQRHVERRGRHVLEVVGAVEPGGAVQLGGARRPPSTLKKSSL